MKKLKIFVAALIILGLLVMLFFMFYKGTTSRIQATSALPQEDLVARGEYLARAGDCVACHTATGGTEFAGGLGIESPIGIIYSTNITPDKADGIGSYTLQDFDNAVRYGIRKDGISLYPAMPFPSYALVTDEDVEALYAYFMHGVEPSPGVNKRAGIMWPLSMRWPLAAWRMMFAPDVKPFVVVAGQDEVTARGAYLVQGLGHCGTCHTPRSITLSERAYSEVGNHVYLSGSEPLEGWIAINLRGDHRDGLGGVSEDELFNLLKTGRNNTSAVFGGMADVVNHSLQYLTDDDLRAIAHYLKALPAKDPADKPFVYDDTLAKALSGGDASMRGGQVYIDNCAACHRTDGRGYAQTFPALAGNPTVQGDNPASLINIVLQGHVLHGTKGAPTSYTMPGFAWRLNDQEVADVVTLIRTSWGNLGKPVSATEVAGYRRHMPSEVIEAQARN